MSTTRAEEDKDWRQYLLACLKVLDGDDKRNVDFIQAVIKDGIATFEQIQSPCDTDFFLLAKLYIELSFIYRDKHHRAQHLAAFDNAKAALSRCRVRDDDFLRNVVYLKSKEAKQERFFPELKQESLAALEEALTHYHEIKHQTDEDVFILVELYNAQAKSYGDEAVKGIASLKRVFTALEMVKDKNTSQYEREMVYAYIALAKQYRLEPNPNYQLALAQGKECLRIVEANPNKSDWHYAQISLIYHNLAMDLRDLKAPNKEVLRCFSMAMEASNNIKSKSDLDYKGMIKTLNYLALFYSETNQQHLISNYITPFFYMLGAIQNINAITLQRAQTIIRLMVEVTWCDRQLIDALYFADKAVAEYHEPLMNPFLAFLYDYCTRSSHMVTRQTALVLTHFISFLLHGAKNKTLPNNDFKIRLEVNPAATEAGELLADSKIEIDEATELEDIKQLKLYRAQLQEHPIHQFSEQIGHGMPFMMAMTTRLQYLEVETAALRAEVAQLRAASVTPKPEAGEPEQKKHAGLFQGRK